MKDIQLEARVKILREALECSLSVMDAYCPDVEREIIASVRATFNNSSTGKEQLERDLEEAERVLEQINEFIRLVTTTLGYGTPSDKQTALKKEWEAKRDSIKEALEGLK